MPKAEGSKRTDRLTTKNMRVEIEDWLYIHKLAGEGTPLKVAVHELVETHKEAEDKATVEVPDDFFDEE